eukprot:IDg6767t1
MTNLSEEAGTSVRCTRQRRPNRLGESCRDAEIYPCSTSSTPTKVAQVRDICANKSKVYMGMLKEEILDCSPDMTILSADMQAVNQAVQQSMNEDFCPFKPLPDIPLPQPSDCADIGGDTVEYE